MKFGAVTRYELQSFIIGVGDQEVEPFMETHQAEIPPLPYSGIVVQR